MSGMIDNVRLGVSGPSKAPGWIDDANRKITALNATIGRLKANLANVDSGAAFKRTTASFLGDIKTSGPQNRRALTKLFGFDEKDVREHAARLSETAKKSYKQMFSNLDTLRNPTQAARFFSNYSRTVQRRQAGAFNRFDALFGGGVAPASAPPPAAPPAGGGGGSRSRGGSASGGGGQDKRFSEARLKVLQELAAAEGSTTRDPSGLAAAQKKAASQLEALGKRYELSGVQAERLGLEVEKLRTKAVKQLDRAFSNASGTTAQRLQRQKRAIEAQSQQSRAAISGPDSSEVTYRRSIQSAEQARLRRVEADEERRRRVRARQQQTFNTALADSKTPPPLPPTPPRGPAPKKSMFDAFTPGGFAGNLVKVTGWAAAVTTLYKATELAGASLGSLVETGAQMARLDQVFSKVGGTTRELTSDVLSLAAANGRSRQEAMEAAVQWSRLGLTRAQVNEAVRVSLLAANVAEISAAEATEKLQAVMAAYGLRVGEVAGVLGELNAVSNVFNATVGGMLEGLSRTASVAKQAGLPLSELVGILGATIGTTGQSGANIGNAIKSITVALSNPVLQSLLREKFRVEVTTGGGEDIKEMSLILGDLFDAYQRMNDAQRQNLLFSVAGKTQASRLAAILDSYVRGQSLAITAQLNLNSAEQENARIKATLKSRLEGLRAEWERFIAVQGTAPRSALGGLSISEGLGESVTFIRNILDLMNQQFPKDSLGYLLNRVSDGLASKGLSEAFPVLKALNDAFDRQRGGTEATRRAAAGFDAQAERFGGIARAGDIQKRSIKRLLRLSGGGDFLETLAQGGPQPFLNGADGQRSAQGVMRQLRALKEAGDIAGVRLILERELAAASERTVKNRELERETLAKNVALLDEQIAKLDDLQGVEYTDARAKEIAALSEQRNKTRVRLDSPNGDENPDLFEIKSQRMLVFQERTRGQLEAISRLYRDMPVNGAVQAAEMEMEMLQQQIRLLNIKKTTVEASGAAQSRIVEETMALQKQRTELEAQFEKVSGQQAYNRVLDRVGFGSRFGSMETSAFDYGASPTERLLNRRGAQRDAIESSLRALNDRPNDALEAGRLFAAVNGAIETEIRLLERSQSIHAEINQLVVDRNREFQKSLLGAGPSELLRKMAAFQLNKKGVSNGQFMALSPEMRGDVAMLDPRFDPEAMNLQGERNRLNKLGLEPDKVMKQIEDLGTLTNGVLEGLLPVGPIMNEAAAGMRELANATLAAVNNLANLEVLRQLPGIVSAIAGAARNPAGALLMPALPQAEGVNAGQ